MSRQGLRIALQTDATLPAFDSPEEARIALFAQRDLLLDALRQIAQPEDAFRFDGSPESLKGLERWYFDLLEGDGFRVEGNIKDSVRACCLDLCLFGTCSERSRL